MMKMAIIIIFSKQCNMFTQVSLPATKALSNMDQEFGQHVYKPGYRS